MALFFRLRLKPYGARNYDHAIVVYETVRKLEESLLHSISMPRYLPSKVFILLVAMLILTACASNPKPNLSPPPALQYPTADVQVTDVDVLALTPAMEAFMQRYVLLHPDLDTRLNLLNLSVANTGVLGFDFDDTRTLSAAKAFETRSGNCIGFANMMVAMARRAGLKAQYQEVLRRPEWSSFEDTTVLTKHINVVISSNNYSYVVDASGASIKPTARRRLISDAEAKALYFSNIGVDALLNNDIATSYAYLVKAIDVAPRISGSWVNLGVLFGRNKQLGEAAQVQQTALQIDANDYSAMNNLYGVYIALDELEAAQDLQDKVEKYRQKNPYYLLKLSEEARQEARFDDAINLLQRAIRKKENEHLLHFAMAKTQYLSGETIAAQTSLQRARELVHGDMLAHYNQPLNELVSQQ